MFLLVFVQTATASSDLAQRKEIIKQEFAEGDKIAKLTKNENAVAIMKFLHESAFIGQPIYNKNGRTVKFVEVGGKKDYYLCIVPLLKKDRGASKEWREAYDENLAAFHIPDPRQPLLVLKERSQFSGTWQGLILIHEGSHALAFAANVFNDIEDSLKRRTMDELYAYSLEAELAEKIGGQEYSKLIQEEVKRLEQGYRKNKEISIPDYPRYSARLDKIFGKSCSKLETGVRGSILWITAVFHVIEKNYKSPDEQQQRKADFLWSAYKNGNMQ
ncbi:MAG: hypothetical protein COZ27_02405 [Candidatus Moranbacteria bacterium CG_4_10_14_3_um_filter_41_65]|nr:MAG: hypothetical protein AUK58_01230 [Candidatus Moranbacteria bacterium CG2_30_41_165]PIP25262.1 MAG: hypothetical protein COX32_04650 [Candidatus Moranbacteria bacterium CG23_combo_of_CG06-09_8_20_14_all_41_28]PIV86129.1 MAG: hypothetical protein COW50_03215 [Candidatus Moranbacteria bacterium CG17_big_fil_post_rev_8_21_14_2_50_41_107]PIW94481.1 MAG: hypothetical protein COZ86_00800 [Candidatus Moranbacteria bacterium CG_4_8_14_3_um_filter_41_13]PIX91513.1 MAG: hypothetical protein COZ27_